MIGLFLLSCSTCGIVLKKFIGYVIGVHESNFNEKE